MTLLVHDVERGLCVAVTSPAGLLLIIDCGRRANFSPVINLASNAQCFAPVGAYRLASLVVTHPHADHLASIQEVTAFLPPYHLVGRNDLDWGRVMSGGIDTKLVHYLLNYLPPVRREIPLSPSMINWGDGMVVRHYCLYEPTAQRASSSDNAYVNNTSIVTVIRYQGYAFAVLGDIESEGLRQLLRQARGLLLDLLFGVDFLVTSHHGHPSGFAPEWFAITGPTRRSNIVSERRRRTGEKEGATFVDPRYSKPEYSLAMNRQNRRMVSTRYDGPILVQVYPNGQWSWNITS